MYANLHPGFPTHLSVCDYCSSIITNNAGPSAGRITVTSELATEFVGFDSCMLSFG